MGCYLLIKQSGGWDHETENKQTVHLKIQKKVEESGRKRKSSENLMINYGKAKARNRRVVVVGLWGTVMGSQREYSEEKG